LQISPLHSPDGITLQTLIDSAKEKYFAQEYSSAIKLFEKALVNYRMMQHVEVACRAKCRTANITKDLLLLDVSDNKDLAALGDLLAQTNCHKLCVEGHPYGVTSEDVPSDEVLQVMEQRDLYNFLQFAYFKTNTIKKACKAVYTYHQQHPDNEQTLENIEYYKSLPGVDENDFVDLEEGKFYKFYVKGVEAYANENYEDTIVKMERCLVEYFQAINECETLCYKAYVHTYFHRYYKALSMQYMDHINCSLQCEENLMPSISGQKVDKFSANCLSYLQFSYYQTNNIAMAASAASAALLLDPKNPVAQRNVKFYENYFHKEGSSNTADLSSRMDAMKFYSHFKSLQDMLDKGLNTLSLVDDEGHVSESSDDPLSDNEKFFEAINDRITEKLKERFPSFDGM